MKFNNSEMLQNKILKKELDKDEYLLINMQVLNSA